jgi:hypothetical protein
VTRRDLLYNLLIDETGCYVTQIVLLLFPIVLFYQFKIIIATLIVVVFCTSAFCLTLLQTTFSQVFDLQASDIDNDDSSCQEGYLNIINFSKYVMQNMRRDDDLAVTLQVCC